MAILVAQSIDRRAGRAIASHSAGDRAAAAHAGAAHAVPTLSRANPYLLSRPATGCGRAVPGPTIVHSDPGDDRHAAEDPARAAILRRPQVEQRTGLSRSTLYQYSKDGDFPKPVRLGLRAVGWLESDISDWIAARVKGARQGNAPAAR
jgi:prophage regulatory protein